MKEIAQALVKAQKAFGPALKTSSNPHFRSKYADLSACVEAVIDGLNNNGIFLSQPSSECEDGVIVETVFIHESGESWSAGKLHVPASKQDPQGYGSALTYARRYSLMAACGIAPEDDDGNAASKARQAANESQQSGSPARIEWDKQTEGKKATIRDYVFALDEEIRAENYSMVYERIVGFKLDNEDWILLSSQLDAKTRAALKRIGEDKRKKAA